MRGRIGKGLWTISFTRKPSLRQHAQCALAFPRPGHPSVPAAPLRQEQECKLIDRLLKPDLTLQNSAQNKKFVTRSTSGDRPLKTRRFFWQRKTMTKTFSNMRNFSTRSFQTGSFQNHRKMEASLHSKTTDKSDFAFGTQTAEARQVPDGEKKIDGHAFAGNRPFVGQGKSQKALSARKPPLTIDQVRELLNKNR